MTRLPILAMLLAALVQTGLLVKILTDRASALQSGQEVVLKSTGFDPRDLFRGHYVMLRLDISRFPLAGVQTPDSVNYGDTVWVELAPGSDGFARPIAIHTSRPETAAPVLRGTAQYYSASGEGTADISYPFTRYYAEKTRALELDDINRAGELGVILSLQPDGSGLIKGLTIDGTRIYEESLF